MAITMLYMTAPSKEVASDLAKKMVEEKLAACVNILGSNTSIYFWDGKVSADSEVTMIVKTIESKYEQLLEWTKLTHPYDVPCVLKIPILDGLKEYNDWIHDYLS